MNLPALTDKTGMILATLRDVTVEGNWSFAEIIDDQFPDHINILLATYLDLANQQILSLLDEIEEQIRALDLWFVLTDSQRMRVSHILKADNSIAIEGEWIIEQTEHISHIPFDDESGECT